MNCKLLTNHSQVNHEAFYPSYVTQQKFLREKNFQSELQLIYDHTECDMCPLSDLQPTWQELVAKGWLRSELVTTIENSHETLNYNFECLRVIVSIQK